MIDHTMGDKQKPEPETDNLLPPEDEQHVPQNGSRPSYYYDDATGYEIYTEETDEEDEDDNEK